MSSVCHSRLWRLWRQSLIGAGNLSWSAANRKYDNMKDNWENDNMKDNLDNRQAGCNTGKWEQVRGGSGGVSHSSQVDKSCFRWSSGLVWLGWVGFSLVAYHTALRCWKVGLGGRQVSPCWVGQKKVEGAFLDWNQLWVHCDHWSLINMVKAASEVNLITAKVALAA